jgi:nitronate monooxygenase
VTHAGGIASLGGGYYSPDKLHDELIKIRSRIDYKPFNINLFVPSLTREFSYGGDKWPIIEEKLIKMNNFLNENVRAPLNIPKKQLSDFSFKPENDLFDQQCEAIWRAFKSKPFSPNVFSFTFGIPAPSIITRFKDEGFTVVGTATTLQEVELLDQAKVDAVCIQGESAGGHRGTFIPFSTIEEALISTETLILNAKKVTLLPLIAAGGISSYEDVTKFLKMDCPVQIGTAFLTCSECATTRGYKDALMKENKEFTVTNVYTGRYARAISNSLSTLLKKNFKEEEIPPFPYQHTITSDIRSWSSKNDCEYFHLWSGDSAKMCKEQSAFDLIKKMFV